MRKVILYSLLSMIVTVANGQTDTLSHSTIKNDLIQKSKNQNTTGWILIIGGAGLGIFGFSTYSNSLDESPWAFSDGKGLGFSALGLIAMGGGGILLKASKRNKNKAMSMTFTDQPVMLNKIQLARVPSVTVVIEL